MKKYKIILVLLVFTTCSQREPIEPFKVEVYDYNYSLAYSRKFTLTEKELNINFKGELEGENDSVIFKEKISSNKYLRSIAGIDFYGLDSLYENNCVDDGLQMFIIYEKENKKKTIQISNYYQRDIGNIIEFINKIVPKKHKIYYDKKELLEYPKDCS